MKALITGRSKPAIKLLARVIADSEYEIACRHISNGHSDPLYGLSSLPDVLVFHLSQLGEEELFSLLEHPLDQRPSTLVIGPAGNTTCMRIALKAGVCDYLEEPITRVQLLESMNRIRKQHLHAAGRSESRLISIAGSKGGSGVSFLAANLAHIMTVSSALRVAMMDLDLQFGCSAQYLGVSQQHGLVRALDVAEHLDPFTIDAFMTKHQSGLSLLGPLEDEILLRQDIPTDRFARLVDLIRATYDRVVIDQPRQLDDMSIAVYERADHILLVMQQELANIQDAARLQNILLCELKIPRERITLMLNRYDKTGAVELSDIAKTMNVDKSAIALIPNSYQDVAESTMGGVPMLEHAPDSPVTKALMALEKRLAGEDERDSRSIFARARSQLMGG